MAKAKAIIVLFIQALLAQIAFSQCLGRAGIGARIGYDGLYGRGPGCGCGGIGITATSGGGLPVASASAIPPVGVSIASENVYDGILSAAGELPFVGTVGVEGVLPTAGAGAVNYGCGNGCTGMVSDITPGIAGPYGAYGAGIAGPYGAGIAGPYGAGIAGPYGAGIADPYVGALGYGALGYGGWADRGCGCGCGAAL